MSFNPIRDSSSGPALKRAGRWAAAALAVVTISGCVAYSDTSYPRYRYGFGDEEPYYYRSYGYWPYWWYGGSVPFFHDRDDFHHDHHDFAGRHSEEHGDFHRDKHHGGRHEESRGSSRGEIHGRVNAHENGGAHSFSRK